TVAINGERIDITATGAHHDWRVVIGCEDGVSAKWVAVFRRPTPFAGVAGGCAVVINGPSSSGKSALLAAIAEHSTDPWVAFDEPFFGTVAVERLIWRDDAPTLHRGFLDGIGSLARS